jgi:hypothetical protein
MSRHIFDAKVQAQPIRVTVGYDRPTTRFYLHIGWVDPQTDEILSYASDLGLAYEPSDLRSIRRFLEKTGIEAPAAVWTEVAFDATSRAGNRVVKHSSDGTMRELAAW